MGGRRSSGKSLTGGRASRRPALVVLKRNSDRRGRYARRARRARGRPATLRHADEASISRRLTLNDGTQHASATGNPAGRQGERCTGQWCRTRRLGSHDARAGRSTAAITNRAERAGRFTLATIRLLRERKLLRRRALRRRARAASMGWSSEWGRGLSHGSGRCRVGQRNRTTAIRGHRAPFAASHVLAVATCGSRTADVRDTRGGRHAPTTTPGPCATDTLRHTHWTSHEQQDTQRAAIRITGQCDRTSDAMPRGAGASQTEA